MSDQIVGATGDYCFGSFLCHLVNEILVRRAAGELTYGLAGTIVP